MSRLDGKIMLRRACERGRLLQLAEKYVLWCDMAAQNTKEEGNEAKKQKRKSARLPNVAGFCRFLGIGASEYASLSKSYPDEFEKVECLFEDEALNSEVSPTLLGVYLKRRLGYDESTKIQKNDVDVGALKLIFEHDILADGE